MGYSEKCSLWSKRGTYVRNLSFPQAHACPKHEYIAPPIFRNKIARFYTRRV
jgi:hypothetical protein